MKAERTFEYRQSPGGTQTMGDGDFTRRDVLAGLGVIGAGVGAGAVGYEATGAVLNDSEGFLGNILTAGQLDLNVDYSVKYERATDTTPTCVPDDGSYTVDGRPTGGVKVGVLKPGTQGRIDLCPTLPGASNPGYIWLCGSLRKYTNGIRRPNGTGRGVDDQMQIGGNGQNLGEVINARLRYIDPTTAGCDDPLWCQDESSDHRVLLSGSFVDVVSQLDAGIPLNPSGLPGIRAGDQGCFRPGEQDVCLRLEWCVPDDQAGNAISGDRLEFDLVFRTRQCRHTDGTTNPCRPGRDGDQGISFIAFCTAEDTAVTASDISLSVAATNDDGEPTAVDWTVENSTIDIDSVVLYYATTFENFYYGADSAIPDPVSGTAAVGKGDAVYSWPRGGTVPETGQSPDDPCPGDQRGIKYDWLELKEQFEHA